MFTIILLLSGEAQQAQSSLIIQTRLISYRTNCIVAGSVVENARHPGLSANCRTSIEPDGFLLPRTMIRNCRHDQLFELSCRTIGDDVRMRPKFDKPRTLTPDRAKRVGQHCYDCRSKLRPERYDTIGNNNKKHFSPHGSSELPLDFIGPIVIAIRAFQEAQGGPRPDRLTPTS
jgi:hypothetical protein